MIAGLRGTLVSDHFAEHELAARFRGRLGESDLAAGTRRLRAWRRQAAELGPASSVRAILDVAAVPLVTALGFGLRDVADLDPGRMLGARLQAGGAAVGLLITTWGDSLDRAWRDAVRHGIRLDADWCLCFNVREVRLVDTRRSYARGYLAFDLEEALDAASGVAALWALLRADVFTRQPAASPPTPLIREVLEHAARHAAGVCRTLERGVLQALEQLLCGLVRSHARSRDRSRLVAQAYDESLTIVYRLLFLLFAEARGLVPMWHPVYRDSYSLEALRDAVEGAGPPPGVWAALLAISRLVHQGCRAGDLRVTPFNGRLFAPARTPLAESSAVSDEAAAQALAALSTQPGRAGRVRISYRDLGVEQLGAVYETALEYRPEPAGNARPAAVELRAGSGRRKATGSFYTPAAVTDYLVRRTLRPLVQHAGAAEILRLRVLDPAMGSGAFLVAACRYLSAAYESALVAEGACHHADLSEADRAGFRRTIARQCLFGVDLNPMAVQLARLSLWLATLAADRPLTFLDHHLAAGDSLVGASCADLARQAPGRPPGGSRTRENPLPLFDDTLEGTLRQIVPARLRLAAEPGDTLAAVRAKEALLADLDRDAGRARWRRVADLWCAWWFWPPEGPPPRAAYAELVDFVLRDRCALPASLAEEWLGAASRIAGTRRFFHWPIEFPEAFFDASGHPLAAPGFDAVVTNPPWDVLRADQEHRADPARAGPSATRHGAGDERLVASFARESGAYRARGTGHANRYQLFVERAVRLARPGGRLGLVVPWGLASDHGSAALRRLLFDHCRLDALVGVDNAAGIFPIHRGVRFLLVTASAGGRTDAVACRFGERDPARLDAIPDDGRAAASHFPVVVSRSWLERVAGAGLAIPDLRSAADLDLVRKIAARFPPLAAPEGWAARFGRELNASDDRRHFTNVPVGLPIVEGKQVHPFRVDLGSSRAYVARPVAARLLDPAVSFERARLAYRDVASATNRLTLIAAILPPGCLTTHTLFCLKTPLDPIAQAFLCGVLNSFVANYLVRLRVVTHVTVALIERLPVPRPPGAHRRLEEIAELAMRLGQGGQGGQEGSASYARLQALVAVLYGLDEREFAHVLETFPLVDRRTRDRVMQHFLATGASIGPPGPPEGGRRARGGARKPGVAGETGD